MTVCGLTFVILVAMKADRKRLTSEKADLVSQMKQLYGTLKDKECELRDFIRNYEQRNKDNNDLIKQVDHCPLCIMSLLFPDLPGV